MRSNGKYGALALVLLGALTHGAACTPSDASVLLRFPNQQAREGAIRIVLEVYDPDTGLVSSGDRTCAEFLGRVAQGVDISGTPRQNFYECVPDETGRCPESWFEQGAPLTIPSGKSIVYVQAFSGLEQDVPPFLEACSDRFDTSGSGDGSQEVPLDFRLILPDTTSLVLEGSSRFSGRAGATLDQPLRVRVQGREPRFGRILYGIPGVPVTFTPTDGVALGGGLADDVRTVNSGFNGMAELLATTPLSPGVGQVAAAVPLEKPGGGPQVAGNVRFVVSSVAQVSMQSVSARVEGLGTPIALTVGELVPSAPPSLVVLGCEAPETQPEACLPGIRAEAPGQVRLSVLDDLDSVPRTLSVDPGLANLGIAPADVFVGQLDPLVGPRIGVLSGRRGDCQDRVCTDPQTCPCWSMQSGTPCPCEGSEVRFYARDGDRIRETRRLTLTASNAVALELYPSQTRTQPRAAVAGQGRRRNERPCSNADRCLDYDRCRDTPETCGCPPSEQCLCPSCGPNEALRCVASDRSVDIIGLSPSGVLRNEGGCKVAVVDCKRSDPNARSICQCLDADRNGGGCGGDTGVDECGCRVPRRIRVGRRNATSLPHDVGVGRFDGDPNPDMVVASEAGLQFFEGSSSTFEWRPSALINSPIHEVVTANFDPEAEQAVGGPALDDVVWISGRPCQRGNSTDDSCPIAEARQGAEGCLGVYTTDGVESLIRDLTVRIRNRCRRFDLAQRPVSICGGDFDGDGAEDVAVASEGQGFVALYLGDGWGGLGMPPLEVALPPGTAAGPMTCADIDGDVRTEIAVADANGNVSILRSN